MKSGQLTLEDHSGCSVAKGLRVRMEAVGGVGGIHMRNNGSLG